MNENEVKDPEHWDLMGFILIAGIIVVFIVVVFVVVSMAVNTPQPSGTSTVTAIGSPTPTSTPVLPTDTPTQALPTDTSTIPAPPADTPTLKPPTPTPTTTPTPPPTPDAVVKAESLNLRSGPGVVYDILRVLKRDDCLKVIGRNPECEGWLKVVCPERKEGWVACSLLQVNVDMASVPVVPIPPTPTLMYTPTLTATPAPVLLPPPILLEPENGAAFIGGPVILKWKLADDRPLGQGELFSLRMYKEGETKLCHHAQARDLEYWGDPISYCTGGKLYWGVTLIRELCTDCPEKERWQELSEPSDERWIYYTPGKEPWTWPTPTPSGGNGPFCPGCR